MALRRLPLLPLAALAAACAAPPVTPAPPALPCGGEPAFAAGGERATLWLRGSVEYRATSEVVYRAALAALERGVADPGWSAEPLQADGFAALPPAVVMDVDETVLDNSEAQARMLLAGTCAGGFRAAWDAWLAERAAPAVPGAAAFVRAARALADPAGRPLRVFFVTNRECAPRPGDADPCPQQADTAANLRALGLDAPDLAEDLMLKGERPDWGSEKRSRREAIARTHRIVLNVGDDFADFLPAVRQADPAARAAAACAHDGRWGTRWFLLPNPMYGSWLVSAGADAGAALAAPPPPACAAP